MKDPENQKAMTTVATNVELRNKSSQVSAIQRAEAGATDYVPHVTVDQVKLMAMVAGQNKRHGERNGLLIKFSYDRCLRVSEELGVRPVDMQRTPDGWMVRVLGKGSKPGVVAISASIAAELQSYCYRHKIAETELIFPISRSQVSGNPKSVQEQLRHKSALMTLRYLKTISHDEAMKIQQQIDIGQM